MMSILIDAKGKPCPQPVLMARKAITDGAQQFTVEVDNTTAVGNLQRMATSQGYAATVTEEAGVYRLAFTKTEAVCPDACGAAPAESYALFVGNDVLGGGDRELGTNLIRMFFYTLAQSEDLPEAICFVNAGVKLPAGDAQVQAHLQTLADAGVKLLVCGTCLNFYDMTEQLAVGTVSNMYDILTQLQRVKKVMTL